MKTEEKKYFSSCVLRDLVLGKYPPPAWVSLSEVRDGTGFSTTGRSADFLAFGTWPSRGLSIIGFEFKSARNDWLRELKDPEKAESIARFCDEWWLVAADDVAMAEEIPASWGWYAPSARGLKTMKAAASLSPAPVPRIFFMSIIRAITRNYTLTSEVEAVVKARLDGAVESRYDANKYELEQLREFHKKAMAFEKASGLKIEQRYNEPEVVGQIVKLVLDSQLPYEVRKIRKAAADLDELLKAVTALPFFEPVKEQFT